MARIYANLIEKGYKTIDQVPTLIRGDVATILVAEGYSQLAGV